MKINKIWFLILGSMILLKVIAYEKQTLNELKSTQKQNALTMQEIKQITQLDKMWNDKDIQSKANKILKRNKIQNSLISQNEISFKKDGLNYKEFRKIAQDILNMPAIIKEFTYSKVNDKYEIKTTLILSNYQN